MPSNPSLSREQRDQLLKWAAKHDSGDLISVRARDIQAYEAALVTEEDANARLRGEWHAAKLATEQAEHREARLREALEAIVVCEAPFSLSPLTHARNAVEHCQSVARAALAVSSVPAAGEEP